MPVRQILRSINSSMGQAQRRRVLEAFYPPHSMGERRSLVISPIDLVPVQRGGLYWDPSPYLFAVPFPSPRFTGQDQLRTVPAAANSLLSPWAVVHGSWE